MKDNKFNQNIFYQKKSTHTRNKSIKLSEIKNLYSSNLNKSLNGPIKANFINENAIRLKHLETEANISKGKFNYSKDDKYLKLKLKNTNFYTKIPEKNSFSNYISNARKNRNSSAIYNNNKSIIQYNLADNHLDVSSNDISFNLSFNKPMKPSESINYPSSSNQNAKFIRKFTPSQLKSKVSGNVTQVNNSFTFNKEDVNKVEDELSDSTRLKLNYLKKLMHDLTKQENNAIKKEIETLYKEVIYEGRKKEDNININERIDQINNKYEIISKENEQLRNLVKDKTDDIEELKQVLLVFQKDLKELKNNKIAMMNNLHNKKQNKSIDMTNKNTNIFKKKMQSQKNIKITDTKPNFKILKKKDNSTVSSGKFSTPDKNLKISTTATHKTNYKNDNFDDLIDSTSLNSVCSGNIAKEIYYFQPKYNIQSKQPKNIPRININAIPKDETIKSNNSNLNKGFDLSLKSLETINQEGNRSNNIEANKDIYFHTENIQYEDLDEDSVVHNEDLEHGMKKGYFEHVDTFENVEF